MALPVKTVTSIPAQRFGQWVVRVVRVIEVEQEAREVLAAQVMLHIQAETVPTACPAALAAVAVEEPEMLPTAGLPLEQPAGPAEPSMEGTVRTDVRATQVQA